MFILKVGVKLTVAQYEKHKHRAARKKTTLLRLLVLIAFCIMDYR